MGTIFSKLGLASALAVAAVLLLPGLARATPTTWTYPSAACPNEGVTPATANDGLDDCINDVASLGDTIKIKPGIYHEAGTTVTQAVTVTGTLDKKGKCKTPSAVVINPDQSGDGFYVTADNVTIQCLEIDHAGAGYRGVELDGAYSALHLLNLIIQDAGTGVFAHNGAADGLQVKNSTVKGISNYGIEVDDTSNAVTISNDLIRNTGGNCFYMAGATNTTISNNVLTVCNSDGIQISGGGGVSGPNSILGNTLRSVDSTGIDVTSSYTTIDKNTIDTTESDGIYFDNDHLTVTNNVLSGTISGTGIDGACTGTHETVLISGNQLAANGGTGDNFICAFYNNATITKNTANGFVGGDGIRVGSGNSAGQRFPNAVISGNKLLGGVNGAGVVVWGDSPTVSKNVVANSYGNGFDIRCTIAVAVNCSGASVTKNMQSASVSDCLGIYIYTYGTGLTVSGNEADDNPCYGFYFSSNLATSSVTVTNNVAKRNGFPGAEYGGFLFYLGGGNTITGNLSKNNGAAGFYVETDGNTFSGNTATGNTLHGFQVAGGSNNNALTGNTAKTNLGDGFNNDGTNTTFTNNTAAGNNRDCTNDVGEGASTLGPLGSNSCADGHVFDWETLLGDT